MWALDNRGFHATKVAAKNKRLECCRYLDNIAIHLQTQHPDHVRSLQSKSLKELEKRVKEAQKHGSNHKAKKYPYATVPVKRTASDPHLVPRSGKKISAEEIARQNFVLQRPEEGTDNPVRDSGFISQTASAKNTFRPLPRMHSGAILNTLSDLAKQPVRLNEDLHSINSDPSHNRHSAAPRPKRVIPLVPLPMGAGEERDFTTENDSPLTTFLHSIDMLETAKILHREKMDLNALMLCNEEDLKSIGLALGPRKKILNAIESRKQLLTQPGEMKDSEV